MQRPLRDRLCALCEWLAPAACALALLGVTSAAGAAPVALKTLDVTGTPDATHLVLDLGGSASASLFTLTRPDRVVVDLKAVVVDRQRLKVPAAQGLVRKVRLAPRDGGVLRIVLEVDRQVRAHWVANENAVGEDRRLTVELAPLGADLAGATAVPAEAPAAPPERKLSLATRDLIIAVDAGHGGDDPGATGRDGTREKDVTLAVARVLAARINSEPGMRAVLTRNGDYFVPLRERIRRARVAQADLFVSVHADAVVDRSVAGSSVYVLSQRGASSEAAKWLADRENAADLVGGVSLDDKDDVLASVLLDLSQSAAMSASMVAAEKVLDELNEVGEVRKARVQQAGFVVLKSPDVPSLLIETAYITNPGEERRLRDPHHQARLAEAILTGIRNYFRENPPPGTRLAMLAASAAGSGAAGGAAAPASALRR
ncbi:MAG TPA: N-acetylmuramoyl-L-alanine amidase [Steroidobacteraceae bacterium]|nr:N-acetylmuramoyl-L-alanine amidase [Steroidobacteraceae bacterium]